MLDIDSHTYVEEAQFDLHAGLPTIGVGTVSDSVLTIGPVPLTGLPCLLLVGEDVPNPEVT